MDSTTKLIKELKELMPIYFHPTRELRKATHKQGKIINKMTN